MEDCSGLANEVFSAERRLALVMMNKNRTDDQVSAAASELADAEHNLTNAIRILTGSGTFKTPAAVRIGGTLWVVSRVESDLPDTILVHFPVDSVLVLSLD